MWTPEEFSTATIEWANKNPDVKAERGKILSWDDYWQHSRSLGAEKTRARTHFESTENVVVTYQGNRYFVGAAHFQFVAFKAVLKNILPIPSTRPMGQVRNLDIALNDRGYLRFCTSDWWVRHMGNTLEAEQLDMDATVSDKKRRKYPQKFWRLTWVRRIVAWIYHRSFEILYKD
jgi:hypothetical protein